MGPAEALLRIAYLLERGGAETYKVRAFRQAAIAVDELGPGRLEQLASSRRLKDIPGVGDTTAGVIAEAIAGGTPGYLAQLEAVEPRPLSPDVLGLRASLRGDCHSHSDWSDGGSPIREMAEAAVALGHEYLVVTDHSPRLTVAHGLTAERLRSQLEVIGELNEELAPFRLLTGIEVDILEDGSLDQDEELLAALDVVVASAHSKLRHGGAPDDQAHGGGGGEPPQRHPRPLHGSALDGQGPRTVELRCRGRLQRLREDREGSRDQLAAGETRPAGGTSEAGRRSRLLGQHRH